MVKEFKKKAEKNEIAIFKIGVISKEKIFLNAVEGKMEVMVEDLIKLNESLFDKKFS